MRRGMDLRSVPLRAGIACSLALRSGLVGNDGRLASFARGSPAWFEGADGLIHQVAAGIARQRPDIGTLVEGSRTNRLLWSRDVTNAAWTKGAEVTIARTTGIDGVQGGASLVSGTGTGARTVYQYLGSLASAARVASFYVRRVAGTGLLGLKNFDGSNGPQVQVGDTWQRVVITGAAATVAYVGIWFYAGDQFAIDFTQLEEGTAPSGPIETQAAAVTRAADVLAVATDGWPVERGWVEFCYATTWATPVASMLLFDARTAYNGNGYAAAIDSGGRLVLITPAAEARSDPLAHDPGRVYSVRIEWAGGRARVCRDGSWSAWAAVPAPAAVAATAYIGAAYVGTNQLHGWISDLALGV